MNFKTVFVRLITLSVLIFANSISSTAQPDSIYRLPAGTRIRLKMDVELSSKAASMNDTFTAVVAKPVKVRDTIALPVGTVIEGRVTSVSKASAGLENGSLELVFESLRFVNLPPRTIDGFVPIIDPDPDFRLGVSLSGIPCQRRHALRKSFRKVNVIW